MAMNILGEFGWTFAGGVVCEKGETEELGGDEYCVEGCMATTNH